MTMNIPRRAIAATGAAVAAATLAVLLVPDLRRAVTQGAQILSQVGDVDAAVLALRDFLLGFGFWAPAVSAVLMVVQSIAAPIPAFLLTFTNGLLFGWAWGALLSWSSAMLGAAVCFGLARGLGRPVVERLAGGSRALDVSDLFFDRYGPAAILIARLLPFVSFDVISYGVGLTPVRFGRFLLATGLGQLPATLLYSWLGQSLTGSVRAIFWAFSITLAIAVLGWVLGPRVLDRLRAGRAQPQRAAEVSK